MSSIYEEAQEKCGRIIGLCRPRLALTMRESEILQQSSSVLTERGPESAFEIYAVCAVRFVDANVECECYISSSMKERDTSRGI